jgi:hypothetical protein
VLELDYHAFAQWDHGNRIALGDDLGLSPNECFVAKCGTGSVLARYYPRTKGAPATAENISRSEKASIYGITPRNKEQRFALELLMDPEVSLVTLAGMAGTGKTLLALAAGLQQVSEDRSMYGWSSPAPCSRWARTSGFSLEPSTRRSGPGCSPSTTTLIVSTAARIETGKPGKKGRSKKRVFLRS